MTRSHLCAPVVEAGRHSHAQMDLAEVFRQRILDTEGAAEIRKMVGFVYAHSAIEGRHLELGLDELAAREGGWYRMVNAAILSLATRTLEKLAASGTPLESFDALVVVSSGYAGFPALSRLLQNAMGLRLDALCYDLAGLGCAGPTHGIQLADMLVQTGSRRRVCVLCVDVMGTHGESRVHHQAPNMSQLVAHCLASDGAAAVVVSDEPLETHLLSWGSCRLVSKLWPDSLAENDFTASEDGEPMIAVGKEIRTRLLPELGPIVEELAPETTYFHPGGASLMRTLGTTFPDLLPTLELSSKVLREHGNIGSASVLWVLDAARAAGRSFGPRLALVALGPGIVSTMLDLGEVEG